MSRRMRGFTLIELIIAIGLFAIISAIAYGTVNRVVTGQGRIEAERKFWRGVSLAWVRIEDDLWQARARPVLDRDGQILPAFAGRLPDNRTLGLPNLEFTRGGVWLPPLATAQEEEAQSASKSATTSADLPPPRPDLMRVAYRLKEGTLYRLTWPALDRAPQTEPKEAPLLREVDDFGLRFMAMDRKWSEVWPPVGSTLSPEERPRGVEIALRLKGRGEFKRVFLIREE